MYTVIGANKSRTFRVLWMLEELGEAYEHVPAFPGSDDVKRYNASGKIPVLLDEGQAISDSTAIITYLADKHGKLTAPAGTIERARQDAVTNRILDEFDGALWSAARNSFVLPEDKRVPAVKENLKWEFARSEAGLARDLPETPFLMGDALTIPDILLTHCFGWAITAKFGVTEPRWSAYLDRMKARPAYQRARAL